MNLDEIRAKGAPISTTTITTTQHTLMEIVQMLDWLYPQTYVSGAAENGKCRRKRIVINNRSVACHRRARLV